MNLFLLGIIIFVILYLFLNWFAHTSSKKIVTNIKKITVYLSLILAAILTIGGKYIFSLPFLFVILSGLKIKGLTALQVMQLWRLIQYLKNSGRFSQGKFGHGSSKQSSKTSFLKLLLETIFRIHLLHYGTAYQTCSVCMAGVAPIILSPDFG